MVYPTIDDHDSIRKLETEYPPSELETSGLSEEISHWNRLIDEAEGKIKAVNESKKEKIEKHSLRWGGLGLGGAGLLTAFVAPYLAVPIAIGGFAVTAYGEYRSWKKEGNNENNKNRLAPARRRRKILQEELLKRTKD
jgi:hypothetical protein